MPLSAAHVEKLRRAWFDVSGELVTNEEAWNMATRVLVFFDALARCPAPGVDKSGLTGTSKNGIDGDSPPS